MRESKRSQTRTEPGSRTRTEPGSRTRTEPGSQTRTEPGSQTNTLILLQGRKIGTVRHYNNLTTVSLLVVCRLFDTHFNDFGDLQ